MTNSPWLILLLGPRSHNHWVKGLSRRNRDTILSSCTFVEILHRDLYIKTFWYDKVFKALINDWQKIAQNSQDIVFELQHRLFAPLDDRDAEGILDELDQHCEKVYEDYIRKGYEHLQTIRMSFRDWKEVMDCNGHLNG
jgi:hypothetical protein